MRGKIVMAVLLVILMIVFAGCNVFPSTDNSRGSATPEPSIETVPSYYVKAVATKQSSSESIDVNQTPLAFFYKNANWDRVLRFDTTGTWLNALSKLPTGLITFLIVDPTDSRIIYATLYEGNDYKVVKSIDGGENWFVCYTGYDIVGQGGVSFAISNEDHNILYMGGGSGLQKSTDGGKTWKLLSNGIGTYGFLVWTIAIDPNNNSILFAGVEDQSDMLNATEGLEWNGECWVDQDGTPKICREDFWKYPHIPRLFYSGNAGESWTELTSHSEGTGYLPGCDGNPVFIGNPLEVIFDPKNSQVVYLGTEGTGLLRSKHGGKTWEKLTPGTEVVGHIAIDSEGTLYITSTCDDRTVLKSSDGGETWQEAEKIVVVTWQPL